MSTYPPPPATTAGPMGSGASGPRASFGRRLGALLLDSLVFVVVAAVLGGISYVAFGNAILIVLAFVGYLVYEVYFHGRPEGQTLGKKWLGIRVVDFNTGGPIGYGRSVLRLVGRYISGWICYLGYFWMLWDKEKHCWHDKMANDVVVPTEHYPVQR